MKSRIQFVNLDSTKDHIIKIWYDTRTFDTVEEAALAAQTAVRCSQNLIKQGIVFYRIVMAE